jgi:hypothetical protein
LYSRLALSLPERVPAPELYGRLVAELRAPQDAFLCCQGKRTAREGGVGSSSCSFLTTNRSNMQKHTNQQHSVHLSRWSTPSAPSYAAHAEQLWEPVKVQTFFTERRYVRYFIVQGEQGQEDKQGAEEDSCKQTLACLLRN